MNGIEPIDFAVACEVVTERIRRAIHIGSCLPGDKLPPERTLARQLGVSGRPSGRRSACSRGTW